MDSHRQGGCFSGLLRFRRLKAARRAGSETVAANSLSLETSSTGLGSSKLQKALEDEDLAACMHYGSCCDFLPKEGAGGLYWARPPPYPEGNRDAIYKPRVMKTIEDTIDEASMELVKLSLDIHDHPEIMFEEKHAHDVLTSFMASRGFSVTKHYLGLDTAWRAEYTRGKSGRVIGINSEMDALPGIGHGCGHNLIAVAGVAIALGVKAALEKHDVSGKIVLLGTPAEEGGAGKVILLERGGYKDMDACVMTHPGLGPANSSYLGGSLAIQTLDVEFFGKSAHASAAPWEGTNALDAAFLTYSSISVLRQQIKPDHRVHGVIKGTDLAANVIPDYTKMSWFVRAPNWTELEILRERVKACIEAATMATSCKVKITVGKPQYDVRQNSVLATGFVDTISKRYGWINLIQDAGGSTDFGNITYALPALHPSFAIPAKSNVFAHTPGFRDAARTKEAHKVCFTTSKALALTGFRVIDDDDFFHEMKKAFDDSRKNPES